MHSVALLTVSNSLTIHHHHHHHHQHGLSLLWHGLLSCIHWQNDASITSSTSAKRWFSVDVDFYYERAIHRIVSAPPFRLAYLHLHRLLPVSAPPNSINLIPNLHEKWRHRGQGETFVVLLDTRQRKHATFSSLLLLLLLLLLLSSTSYELQLYETCTCVCVSIKGAPWLPLCCSRRCFCYCSR